MKRLAVTIAAVALVLLVGTGTTAALWNDSEAVEGTTVNSGTLKLTMNGQSQVTIGPLSGLYPGGVIATKIALAGQASGNLGLDYTLAASLSDTSSASSTLYGIIDAQVFTQSDAGASCASTGLPDGMQVYGSGGGFTELSALVVTESLVAPAADSATTHLCIRFTIPTGTPPNVGGIELSGAATTFAITATGEGTR